MTTTQLSENKYRWLITGVAGFIGANILETLLKLGQEVVGLDNFSRGNAENLSDVRVSVTQDEWDNFTFINGDILNPKVCLEVCEDIDFVLHNASLGNVPSSIKNPLGVHNVNVNGFLNMMSASLASDVKRFIYGSSSAVYGANPRLPHNEVDVVVPVNPYAVSKFVDELYADTFSRVYGLTCVGLRYFNIFGPRHSSIGPHANVIPKWISQLLNDETVHINGDGKTTRDFCYIDNVVEANILAAVEARHEACNTVYNIAFGKKYTLDDLFKYIVQCVSKYKPEIIDYGEPYYREFREGDVKHSVADINKAKIHLGYKPYKSLTEGLQDTVKWFYENQ